MRTTGVKKTVLGLVAVLGSGMLVACGSVDPNRFEPHPRQVAEQKENLYVAVDPNYFGHHVVSEVYKTVLENRERFAVIRHEDNLIEDPFDPLNEGTADLVVGCTGALLEVVNPVLAEELEEEYLASVEAGETDINSGEWRDRTFDALIGSLPFHLDTADPSNAQGCPTANGLPQNIVPIYRNPTFSRADREILNWASGAITTSELQGLIADAEELGRTRELVEEFVASKGG